MRILVTSFIINIILHFPDHFLGRDCSTILVNGESLDVLEQMMNKITQDTLAFKKHFESLLLKENMCNPLTIEECYEGSYDGCLSELPEASCPGGPEWAIPTCGDGSTCGALFDFTASTLRLAPSINVNGNGNPMEDSVKNTVCYTKQAERYMIEMTELESEYWSSYATSAPLFHYGAEDGVFRIYPGNPKIPCPSTYDPTVRPWYVAGSSGPKDVVLILDTSGSMSSYDRLDIMKEAAIRVINTLGFADYVSVIQFNDEASTLYSTYMSRATSDVKSNLISYIEALEAKGSTNFHDAFDLAFRTLQTSITKKELTTNCHKAILFLTDGVMSSVHGTEAQLFSNIAEKMSFYSTIKPTIFTYSFGSGANGGIPKKIACNTGGLWAKIEDNANLGESMGAYYKYFAYGLSQDQDYVAWVEPYEFASGIGLGTTASAPVYDRSVFPPVFAGVVGLDFSFSAMEKALGEENEAGKEEIISRMVTRSIAQCPNLNITQCQLESLSKEDDRCTTSCALNSTYKISECPDVDYPFDVINNRNNEGRTDEERVCCSVGEVRQVGSLTLEEIQESMCGGGDLSNGELAGIIFGSIAGALLIFGISFKVMRSRGYCGSNGSKMGKWLKSEVVTAIPVPSAPPQREQSR